MAADFTRTGSGQPIALLLCGIWDNVRAVTARRPRSAVLAAMLAFLAICVMGGLSGWHAAAFHDDEPAHAESFVHEHQGGGRPDMDKAIHLAAHAVGQGIALPENAVALDRQPLVAMAWPAGRGILYRGVDPASLLRPPQA